MDYTKLVEKIYAKVKDDAPNLNWMFVSTLVWLPAFGLLPENSLVLGVMKAGFIILSLLSVYAWFFISRRKKQRAIVIIGIALQPLLWSLLIYYARIIEHFYSTFHQSVPLVLLNTALFTIISVRWFIEFYRSHQVKLRELRRRGLLKRHKILDEEQGIFRLTAELPGLDGSSPDKEMEKQFARWRWLDALPISGIAFFLLRTVPASISWMMLLVCVWIYVIFFPQFAKTMALWMELWEWEWDLDRKIYFAGKEKKTAIENERTATESQYDEK